MGIIAMSFSIASRTSGPGRGSDWGRTTPAGGTARSRYYGRPPAYPVMPPIARAAVPPVPAPPIAAPVQPRPPVSAPARVPTDSALATIDQMRRHLSSADAEFRGAFQAVSPAPAGQEPPVPDAEPTVRRYMVGVEARLGNLDTWMRTHALSRYALPLAHGRYLLSLEHYRRAGEWLHLYLAGHDPAYLREALAARSRALWAVNGTRSGIPQGARLENVPGTDQYAEPPIDLTADVSRVIDGNTFVLDLPNDAGGEKVRLRGVATPDPGEGQPGETSRQFLSQLLAGEKVTVIEEHNTLDKDGTPLVWAYLPNKVFVNALVIQEGYCFAGGTGKHPYLKRLHKIEQGARAKGLGLWASGG